MTTDEIKSEISKRFVDDELSVYTNNFCIDEDELYIIVDDIIGSDYTVIKLPLDANII